MSFRLVPKSVTLNDLERRNGVILRWFSEFRYLLGALRKSSRSLSHLLMSSCLVWRHLWDRELSSPRVGNPRVVQLPSAPLFNFIQYAVLPHIISASTPFRFCWVAVNMSTADMFGNVLGRPLFPSKSLRVRGSELPYNTWSLCPPESTPQTACRSVQPFLQGRAHDRPSDRQTTHSVCNNWPHLRSTAMRPNNTSANVYGAIIVAEPSREFTRFIWWMQTERWVAAVPQTKPIDLASCDCESTVHAHHRHLLLLLRPKADTHFTVPQRVEGWIDLQGGPKSKPHLFYFYDISNTEYIYDGFTDILMYSWTGVCKQIVFIVIMFNILWYTNRKRDESLSSTTVCKMTML